MENEKITDSAVFKILNSKLMTRRQKHVINCLVISYSDQIRIINRERVSDCVQ